MMSEFDRLTDEAEQYAQQHPQQVQEGEQDVEKRFGMGGGQQDQGNADQQQGY
jgi:BMFP domain-containing protein YqiC